MTNVPVCLVALVILAGLVHPTEAQWPFAGDPIFDSFGTLTDASPALTYKPTNPNFGIYLAIKGLDNGIYFDSSISHIHWLNPPNRIISDHQTDAHPTLTRFGGTIFVAYKGINNRIYIANNLGVAFPPAGTPILPSDRTNASPTLFATTSRLYLVFKGFDNGIYFASTTDGGGVQWPLRATRIIDNALTDGPPALAQFNPGGPLYLVYKGLDNGIYLSQSADEGVSWTSPLRIISNALTGAPPSIAKFQNRFCLALKGTDNGIYIACSGDGNPGFWPSDATRIIIDHHTDASPSLLSLPGGLALYYKIDRSIYVAFTTNPIP